MLGSPSSATSPTSGESGDDVASSMRLDHQYLEVEFYINPSNKQVGAGDKDSDHRKVTNTCRRESI